MRSLVRMLTPRIMFIAFLVLSTASLRAQTTETFNRMDAAHGYKDVVFGSSFSLLKTKMGLVKDPLHTDECEITTKKYLSFGAYNAGRGIADFSKNKLFNVGFFIELGDSLPFADVLKYFADLYGKPEFENDYYWWTGKKIYMSLNHVVNINEALVVITSKLIESND